MVKELIRVGVRGSKLAVAQATEVIRLLNEKFVNLKFDIEIIKTSGDIHQDVPLTDIGGKGLFIKEIETALSDNRIDIAVHSAKDIPSIEVPGLVIPCAIKRSSPYDAFISDKYSDVRDLPDWAVIGTCSVRRKLQLLRINNTLNIVNLRGNLCTRLNKLSNFDGIVLAEAGLIRIGLKDKISQVLDENLMLSAVGQGIICVQCREDDDYILSVLHSINDYQSFLELSAERSFMKAVNGSCTVPMAALATVDRDRVKFKCMLSGQEGTFFEERELSSSLEVIQSQCFEIGSMLKLKAGSLLYDG